ncbi:efflux RND transporter periplasmic adaptor subunit [Palleronia sp. LCG004]|uniref:efflux RND transporter periplasmic adaptor subunit n=1 Tax=Palleronia sp. LCG004 TaxID=3079304 RepID=UPI0029421F8F|nr:efflux RND transporter periplasmic adaptor subunit [Palleronia sp. LCG004]WOI57296.1 efflux RND transporter periplasmic adaptor subunit [Palleronia sp. LCG004]
MKTFSRIAFGVIVVALFAAGGVYGSRALLSQESDASDTPEDKPVRVGLATPEKRVIEDIVRGVGTLMPIRSVALVPTSPGRVVDVPVASGDRVTDGDLIIRLDQREAEATLAEAEATLSETENEFRRIGELADRNTAADAQLETARAAYRRAEAAAMSARAALDDRELRAPFAGTIGIFDIEPGAYLTDGTEIVTLTDLASMEVDLSLPERYFDRIMIGQSISIQVPAYPGETFDGTITIRAPQIELDTRSFDLRAQIANPDGRLAGGMFAHVRVVLDTYSGLAVPDDAIISEGMESYVYTVTDSTASRQRIEPGRSLGSATEVVEGLDENDRVVIAGWNDLSDGASVEIDEDISRAGLE